MMWRFHFGTLLDILSFNPDKFHFAKDNVEFVGFDISSTGYKPTQNLQEGIREFASMSPFRELLKHNFRTAFLAVQS